ncbi:hypothetical protein [Rhizobium sp. WYCCWR 11146]|uniref:hypothetical protein n=1 Tax=Rhizobium sp. WYCCWR 11146 TaxID=2749833 RepID=UPI0015E7851C|nr:hypothetical protein [Rhizobium sp. WYCCWR 11146]MBA1343925.1 hypothetical protein [Rhizobium sp. WYCCWR 11146]
MSNLVDRDGRQRSADSAEYFSRDRGWEIVKVAALCGSSVSGLATAGTFAGPIPPVSAVLLGASAIGFAGCVAFTVATLAARDDRALSEISDAGVYIGPGLFVAPVGALVYGEDGARLFASSGNVLVGLIGVADSINRDGLDFILGANPDKALFYLDVAEAVDNFTNFREPDFDRNYYNPELNAFEPEQGYDLDTTSPPGMGDIPNDAPVDGEPQPPTADV